MFSTYNLKEFGHRVREIRLNNRLTQKDIYEITFISQDTMRKIENGHVIPKYETLEILSNVFKVDLLNILRYHRSSTSLNDLYQEIDRMIIANTIEENSQDLNTIKTFIDDSNLINSSELELFHIFIDETVNYHNHHSTVESIISINQVLGANIKGFKIENYYKFKYSEIELRLLILVGLIYVGLNEIEKSNDLLLYCYDQYYQRTDNDINQIKIILKLLLNISYNFFRLNNYKKSLKYSDLGIKVALNHSLNYCLPHLLARKGLAQYRLDNSVYKETLIKSLNLFKIIELQDLSTSYERILKENYNIHFENFDLKQM